MTDPLLSLLAHEALDLARTHGAELVRLYEDRGSYLFVYATLQRGHKYHGLMDGSPFVGTARTLPLYRDAQEGDYPALERGNQSIKGELYRVEPARLRKLVSAESHYTLAPVRLENFNQPVSAFFWKGSVVKESKDASGHEHKGAGPGGGQFTSGSGGGSGDKDDREEPHPDFDRPQDEDEPESAKPLSASESHAIKQYTVHAADLNNSLRTGGKLDERSAAIHKELQAVFEKVPTLAEPVTVYRGMRFSAEHAGGLKELLGKITEAQKSGSEITIPGYSSATTSKKIVGQFAQDAVKMEIRMRKGLDAAPHSVVPDQKEVIMNHNSRFRVHSIRTKGNSATVVLEQVA